MNNILQSAAKIASKTAFVISALFGILYVPLLNIYKTGFDGYFRAMLVDMVLGKAYRPFVYRLLVPTIIRWISFLVPQNLNPDPKILSVILLPKWNQEYAQIYLLSIFIVCLSCGGFFLAFRYLFDGIYQTSAAFKNAVSLIVLFVLPAFFKYYCYIYDFATLFFFTLCLGLMVRQKWLLYLIAFILSCLNKETTVLLIFVFAVYYWKRLERRDFIKYFSIQLISFIAIRLWIQWLFRNNPGAAVEFHFVDHNVGLLTGGFDLTFVIPALVLAGMIFYRWSEKPQFLKIGSSLIVIMVGLTLFLGYIDELRDYYEVYPILALLIAHTFARIIHLKINLLNQWAEL